MRRDASVRIVVALVWALAVGLVGNVAACSSCSRTPDAVDAATSHAEVADPPELKAKLDEALRAKGPGYVPRTRHKNADGSPKYVNRLILETSPYLLQHAHNPVHWFAWSDEAFDTARRLGRPVLLSVGYSTCHWCHVMEEESFEDEEIASYLNANYVAIKVDREERPDVDAIYMSAVTALTGSGGWPMTVWLGPDRRPFYGGTYFPGRDGDRGTRVGFLSLLRQLKASYDDNPARIADRASEIVAELERRMKPEASSSVPTAAVLDRAAQQYRARFDNVAGGLEGAPKFPSSLPIRFLLRHHRRTGSADSLRMATLTLEKMARGGMYDQVAGGFHRYSTDAQWLVPHFEKMLYDNALLAIAYLEGFEVTRRADFATVAREILRYVERDMTSTDGAFYSATDADSLDPSGRREEGWFFTWTEAELEKALGAERAKVVGSYYGVTARGNFEGRNILAVAKARADVDAKTLAEAREALYLARGARPKPGRDEKILTAWNGLMISAYSRAALTLHDATYAERAERAAEFVLRELRKDGRLQRTFKDGRATHAAYLDDYAFVIAGLLDLFEAGGRLRWLEEAISLDEVVEKHYEDSAGGCFLTSDDAEKLLAREKPSYDGAEPSGNSVQVLNLLRLGELTTKDGYRRRATQALASFGGALGSNPTSLSEMLIAVDFATDAPKEIVIATPSTRAEAEPFLAKLSDALIPNRVLIVASDGPDLARLEALAPLVASKRARQGKATAYVCEKGTCELPATDPEIFAAQLRKRSSASARER